MNHSCKGLLGLLFGHKFRPVFNGEPTQQVSEVKGCTEELAEFFAGIRRTTYVCSVCTRCGATTKEPTSC